MAMPFTNRSFSLQGKVAIVTGAGARARSIGATYAQGLANGGASVVVADLDAAGAATVAAEINRRGGMALGMQVDITDESSVRTMVDAAAEAFGGIDILVNNAALMAELDFRTPLIETPLEAWNRTLAVNLTGAFLCAQAVAPAMRARGRGKIVNQVSYGAFPATTLYGITKIALVGLTTTLAKQLGPDRINVNAIAPGHVKSEAGLALAPEGSLADAFLESRVSVQLRDEPEALVGALMLLVSPAGDWMTGQVLHVDGGLVMGT
jgi:NAD(P)-dependent dehydrogenase (short-subunit alcohol dehydrogenase family)